jgi:hypothetical protein
MRPPALLLALLVALAGCKSKPSPTQSTSTTAPATRLTDVSTSFDAVRVQFNAHKQEARFLTLLSPA